MFVEKTKSFWRKFISLDRQKSPKFKDSGRLVGASPTRNERGTTEAASKVGLDGHETNVSDDHPDAPSLSADNMFINRRQLTEKGDVSRLYLCCINQKNEFTNWIWQFTAEVFVLLPPIARVHCADFSCVKSTLFTARENRNQSKVSSKG